MPKSRGSDTYVGDGIIASVQKSPMMQRKQQPLADKREHASHQQKGNIIIKSHQTLVIPAVPSIHQQRSSSASSTSSSDSIPLRSPNTLSPNIHAKPRRPLSSSDMEKEIERMYGGLPNVQHGVNTPHHEGHSEFCSCKVKGNFYE